MALLTATTTTITIDPSTVRGELRGSAALLHGGRITAPHYREAKVDRGVFIMGGTIPLNGLVVSPSVVNSRFNVWFSTDIDPTSVDASKILVDGVAVASIAVHGSVIEFETVTQLSTGPHTVTIAAGAVKSVDGVQADVTALSFSVADRETPTVSDLSPAPGTPIGPHTPVSFTVKDDSELGQVLVAVRYSALDRTEVAHDGIQFCSGYSGIRTPITGGFRYQIFRIGGWLAAPTVQVYAVDIAGNEL